MKINFTYQRYWLRLVLFIPVVFLVFFLEERINTYFGWEDIKSIIPLFVAMVVLTALYIIYNKFIKKPFYRNGFAEISDAEIVFTLGKKKKTIPFSSIYKKEIAINRNYQRKTVLIDIYHRENNNNKKFSLYSIDISFDDSKYQPFEDIINALPVNNDEE